MGLCVVILAAVPTWGAWGLSRRTAWLLLVIYVVFQVGGWGVPCSACCAHDGGCPWRFLRSLHNQFTF